MDKLKLCPFCGGYDAAVIPSVIYASLEARWVVRCRTCGGQTKLYNTEEAAIKAWNRRSSDA